MKYVILILCFLLCGNVTKAQKNDKVDRLVKEAYIERYKEDNAMINTSKKSDGMVVLMGNSITEGWPEADPAFFTDNNIVGRGISGQVSGQMLLRFRNDVLSLHPSIVVINAGINDIAENTGAYDEDFTFGNIVSMAEIAEANGITVILTSVLPADRFAWNPDVTDIVGKIERLNRRISEYAAAKGFEYVDYNTPMRNENGGLPAKYSKDGVHPLPEGYKVMEKILLPTIEKARLEKRK